MLEMDSFTYEPIDLDRPAVRLLRLRKGRPESEIECELFQAWLYGDNAMPYEALSYTWGGTNKSQGMRIDGRSLRITENLHCALQHLRFLNEDRILWVDAICINQENDGERTHQVQLMGNIYSSANQVLFWLGPSTHATDVAMDYLKRLHIESTKHACNNWKSTDYRWRTLRTRDEEVVASLGTRLPAGLTELLSRPWFNRIWILQEVANAKRATVYCGYHFVSARIFALAPTILGVKVSRQCQVVLDIMPGPSRNDSWWSERRDLYTLLKRFQSHNATEPRDRIYALLGICSDSHMISADYTKAEDDFIRDVITYLFGQVHCKIEAHYSPYWTVEGFLKHFKALNTDTLEEDIHSGNLDNVARFLSREVEITTDNLVAAAANEESGDRMMAILLEQPGSKSKIDRKVVIAAAKNVKKGVEVITLLHEQRGKDFTITEDVIIAAAQNLGKGADILRYLSTHGYIQRVGWSSGKT